MEENILELQQQIDAAEDELEALKAEYKELEQRYAEGRKFIKDAHYKLSADKSVNLIKSLMSAIFFVFGMGMGQIVFDFLRELI